MDKKFRAKELYESGMTAKEVAREMGLGSHQTVLNWLKILGIQSRPSPAVARVFTDEQKQDMYDRYVSGESVESIGKSYATEINKVSRMLREMGLDVRKRPTRNEVPEASGYILKYVEPNHPYFCMARTRTGNYGSYIPEHRLVMAQHVGRPLEKFETVHHKNGNRQDNRLENLELWEKRHGAGQRTKDLVLQDFLRLPEEDRQEVLAQFRQLGYV